MPNSSRVCRRANEKLTAPSQDSWFNRCTGESHCGKGCFSDSCNPTTASRGPCTRGRGTSYDRAICNHDLRSIGSDFAYLDEHWQPEHTAYRSYLHAPSQG